MEVVKAILAIVCAVMVVIAFITCVLITWAIATLAQFILVILSQGSSLGV